MKNPHKPGFARFSHRTREKLETKGGRKNGRTKKRNDTKKKTR